MKIIIKNFQNKIPVSPARMKQLILKALSCEGTKKSGEITVTILSDKRMRALNLKYLHRDEPTDVLAFDLSAKPRTLIADIIVSSDTAVRNAGIYKTTPSYELNLYLIHGVLHLLGFDDNAPKGARIMRAKEEKYVHT
ncbi:MAG: rRNA maturation RNase YbeY [Omnitrophica WOR_2 bacterium RBG_13_44_8b]|nr:MAG: rRNA maturation RNase YbeY [Omnitrophica WOR_2 bacterium RBG_13_44_8b]